KGEVVYELFGFPITNTIVTTVIVLIAFFFIARYFYSQIQKSDRSLAFYALHGIIVAIYNLFESVLGKKINYFFPLLGSFFVFILMMNWSGLFPGVGSILIEPPKHEVEVSDELVVPDEEAASPLLEEEIIGIDELADEELQPEAPEDEQAAEPVSEGESAEEHEGEAEEKHYVPLMRGGTADLNTTLALALVSVFVTQIY